MDGISAVRTTRYSRLYNPKLIYILAAIFSLLLSYVASFRAVVINPDAICYVQSAETMKMGLSTAMQLCGQAKWPFFSALIYGMANLTQLSYVNAAYLLDAIFSVISVVSFLAIVRFIQDSQRLLWLAAFIILFSHVFNSVREYIIRDHGFWAGYLVSILCLLHYVKTRQWMYALGWSVSCIVATLFRIEGIIFLVLIPWISFLLNGSMQSRWRAFFQLNIFLGLFVGLGFLYFIYHSNHSTQHLGRLEDVRFQVMHGFSEIVQRFNSNAQILSREILSKYAAHDAKQVLVLLLVAWFGASVVGNLSLIYAVLLFYAWVRKCMVTTPQNRLVLWSYIVINILITFTFLIENMFLSKRYLVALSLTFMLWIPFALNKLCDNWPRQRLRVSLICVLIVIFSLGGIFEFGYSKQYILDAGKWLEDNIPAKASLYSNDEQVMYYSRHFGNSIFAKDLEYKGIKLIAEGAWKNFDYLALRMDKKGLSEALVSPLLGQPIQEFSNKRGNKISIYKIH